MCAQNKMDKRMFVFLDKECREEKKETESDIVTRITFGCKKFIKKSGLFHNHIIG